MEVETESRKQKAPFRVVFFSEATWIAIVSIAIVQCIVSFNLRASAIVSVVVVAVVSWRLSSLVTN